nr:MAG: hypothetical protein [Bacteriophage sp.]
MNLTTNEFALEISNALAATGEDYTTTVTDLGTYGTSCEITKHGSDKTLHITPADDSLIDMALYDETGTTIAAGTLFAKTAKETTPEKLANLVSFCF